MSDVNRARAMRAATRIRGAIAQWVTSLCVFGLGAISLATQAAHAALPVGSAAPLFTTDASQGGREFRYALADALKHGPVVLYFYPAAFTSGCTIEAHDFADAVPEYAKLGASVIGVSTDKIAVLDRFSVSACRSKFPVAADPDEKITEAYRVVLFKMTSYANRVSFVITPDDRIIYEYAALDPDKHVANTMAALKAWRRAHP